MKKKLLPMALLFVFAITAVISLSSGISKEGRYDGGGKDMVEDIYSQVVKQNSSLESIEDAINKFQKKKYEALEKYNSYNSYNNTYYADAKSHASRIGDAATKQKALDQIAKSEAAYQTRIADWKTQIAALEAQERELRDQHELLQIATTIPPVEKYQQSLPDNSKLKEASAELKQIIESIKAITK